MKEGRISVDINVTAVRRNAERITVPFVRKLTSETLTLARRWPLAGNPAWGTRTGQLQRTLKSSVQAGTHPTGRVWSDLSYAAAVHNGTKARIIRARSPRGMTFFWKRRGVMVYKIAWVRHPATKGSYFLSRPLQIVAQRHGLKATGTPTP
jgi:hypothetical protein